MGRGGAAANSKGWRAPSRGTGTGSKYLCVSAVLDAVWVCQQQAAGGQALLEGAACTQPPS